MTKTIKKDQTTSSKKLSDLERGLIAWNAILTVVLFVLAIKTNLIITEDVPYLQRQLDVHAEKIEKNLEYIKMFHENEMPHQMSLMDITTEEEQQKAWEECQQDKNCLRMLKRYGRLD